MLRGVRDLGFTQVDSVRIDKIITLEIATTDPDQARTDVEAMCEKLLANPVMEDYRIVLHGDDGDT